MKTYDEGWFDTWRTDTYNAPEDPMPDTCSGTRSIGLCPFALCPKFQGMANFDRIMDELIRTVSFQWKNPDFLWKNPDFLLKHVDYLIKQR